MPVLKTRSKMQRKRKRNRQIPFKSASLLLQQQLNDEKITQLARETGFVQRIRKIRPFQFLISFIKAFAGGNQVRCLSEILRGYIYEIGENIEYKAWHCKLDSDGFSRFMLEVLNTLVIALSTKWMRGACHNGLDQFDDILIQDGSSFGVHRELENVFPGRFKKNGPAAVELHLTYSSFEQAIFFCQLSKDTASERNYLPEPTSLKGKLLLADRGYPKYQYFKDVDSAGGSFLMRLSKSLKPLVIGTNTNLKVYTSQMGTDDFDVQVRANTGANSCVFRVVGLWNPHKREYWLLATNLPSSVYPPEMLRRLYHYRWQVELVFKQWKSYCNLRKFNTRKKDIAMGLIWASLITHVLVSFVGNLIQSRNPFAPLTSLAIAKVSGVFIPDFLLIIANEGFAEVLECWFLKLEPFLLSTSRRRNLKRDQADGALNLDLEVSTAWA